MACCLTAPKTAPNHCLNQSWLTSPASSMGFCGTWDQFHRECSKYQLKNWFNANCIGPYFGPVLHWVSSGTLWHVFWHQHPPSSVALWCILKPICDLGTCFTNNLWAHNRNLVKINVVLFWKIMMRSGHNFAHIMTAKLLWHVKNCDQQIGPCKSKLERIVFSQDLELINFLCDMGTWVLFH